MSKQVPREHSLFQRGLEPSRTLRMTRSAAFATVFAALASAGRAAPQDPSPAVQIEPGEEGAASAQHADPRLPADVPLRIVIRYFGGDAAIQRRAVDLSRGLSAQGLNVADLVESPTRVTANTVSYFYDEDQLGATIAARGLGPEWKCVQRRIAATGPLPRAGTIELAIAGQ